MDSNIRRIPVFVFPTTLNFYLNARHTHKQLLTLYNPYDFPVRFKVLSNASTKYTVIDPEGSIGPQACIDIVIRHTFPIAANCNGTDKFRVTMHDHSTEEQLGRRDIKAKLLQGEPDSNSNDGGDTFQVLPRGERASDRQSTIQYQYSARQNQRLSTYTNTANYLAVLAALVSIAALLLPTKPERQETSIFPTYLHISGNFKLVFAYVLGLVSYVLFRS